MAPPTTVYALPDPASLAATGKKGSEGSPITVTYMDALGLLAEKHAWPMVTTLSYEESATVHGGVSPVLCSSIKIWVDGDEVKDSAHARLGPIGDDTAGKLREQVAKQVYQSIGVSRVVVRPQGRWVTTLMPAEYRLLRQQARIAVTNGLLPSKIFMLLDIMNLDNVVRQLCECVHTSSVRAFLAAHTDGYRVKKEGDEEDSPRLPAPIWSEILNPRNALVFVAAKREIV